MPLHSTMKARHPARHSAIARILLLVMLAVPLGACSSISNWFGEKDDVLPDEPADKLYNEGLYLLNEKNDPKAAVKKFEEVDRQHPYSEWARKSLLMSAYAYYNSREYTETISAAKRYVTLHPGSSDAPYAQYLIGAVLFRSDCRRLARPEHHPKGDRCTGRSDRANIRTPNMPSAPSASSTLRNDQLAGKEMEIGRYYLKKKDFTGAINRFKIVVTRYQRTRHVEEALMRLTECYMALGIVPEAQTAAAVLGHNFPDSPWYKDAYTLVRTGGYEPSANPTSWLSKAFEGFKIGWRSVSVRYG